MVRSKPISLSILMVVFALPACAFGQLPTTGRSFTLSDPAWQLFIPSTYVPRAAPVADMLFATILTRP